MNTDTGMGLSEVLAENYLGIGAIGSEVIASVIDDLTHERFDNEWITEMDSTRSELAQALTSIVIDIVKGGYLHSMRTPDGWIKLADFD